VDTYTRISDPALGQEPRYSLGVSHTILAKRGVGVVEAFGLVDIGVHGGG
jgi:hypothetical protein